MDTAKKAAHFAMSVALLRLLGDRAGGARIGDTYKTKGKSEMPVYRWNGTRRGVEMLKQRNT